MSRRSGAASSAKLSRGSTGASAAYALGGGRTSDESLGDETVERGQAFAQRAQLLDALLRKQQRDAKRRRGNRLSAARGDYDEPSSGFVESPGRPTQPQYYDDPHNNISNHDNHHFSDETPYQQQRDLDVPVSCDVDEDEANGVHTQSAAMPTADDWGEVCDELELNPDDPSVERLMAEIESEMAAVMRQQQLRQLGIEVDEESGLFYFDSRADHDRDSHQRGQEGPVRHAQVLNEDELRAEAEAAMYEECFDAGQLAMSFSLGGASPPQQMTHSPPPSGLAGSFGDPMNHNGSGGGSNSWGGRGFGGSFSGEHATPLENGGNFTQPAPSRSLGNSIQQPRKDWNQQGNLSPYSGPSAPCPSPAFARAPVAVNGSGTRTKTIWNQRNGNGVGVSGGNGGGWGQAPPAAFGSPQ